MLFDYDFDVYPLFSFSRPKIEPMDIDSNDEDTCEMEIDSCKGNC